MSYILEALRKAERERNLGQVPDLQVAHHANAAPTARPLWRRKLKLIVILIAGLCIGLVLWLRPSSRSPAPTPTVAVAPPAPVAAAAPPAESVSGPDQLDGLLDAPEPTHSLPLTEQRKLSETAPIAAAPVPAAPAPSPVAAAPIETPATPEPPKPTMAEQATSEPELPPEVKPLKQMAPDYRGNFPKIRIDVHAYDDDPARRFVIINGRKYHEGETLAEGPSISAIESDGVVLRYNNEEVLVPIGR